MGYIRRFVPSLGDAGAIPVPSFSREVSILPRTSCKGANGSIWVRYVYAGVLSRRLRCVDMQCYDLAMYDGVKTSAVISFYEPAV